MFLSGVTWLLTRRPSSSSHPAYGTLGNVHALWCQQKLKHPGRKLALAAAELPVVCCKTFVARIRRSEQTREAFASWFFILTQTASVQHVLQHRHTGSLSKVVAAQLFRSYKWLEANNEGVDAAY